MLSTSLSLGPVPSCDAGIDISNTDDCHNQNTQRSVPALRQVIYLSFFPLSPFLAQMCNLKPVGTNEKMKGVVTIIALVPRDLWWGHLREEKDNKGKKAPA